MKTTKNLQEKILEEKLKGTPDIDIGKKYGVTYRYIEKVITKLKGVNVSALNTRKKIKTFFPKNFREEKATVWSFKSRGDWATHSGEYRGNWSPYIPRNVILKYSKPGELVLDYFCGAGTTAVEAKLLGRKCIALDINEKAIELAKKNIDFTPPQLFSIYEPQIIVGDARDLSFLKNNSIDLICAHPPYANAIHYTDHKEDDLSFYDVDDFIKEMSKVAKESFRVLKPERNCAILIGDIRRKKNVIPLGFKLIDVYLNAGFKLRELVIKRQHNCKTTGFWYENSIKYNFLLLAHEYLPIFEKPLSTQSKTSEISTQNEAITVNYTIIHSSIKELKREPNDTYKFETTTVWILPRDDSEKRLIENIKIRYSRDGNVLFIKSIFNNNLSNPGVESYLNKIKNVVNQNLLSDVKFVAIQTKDVRINKYVEPLAKRVIDFLKFGNLQLKEIIVVIPEEQKEKKECIQNSDNYLNITHQYLLIYRKR